MSFGTPMGESAAGLHELFVSLREAGFTRGEALELLARLIAAQGRGDE